MERRFHLKQVFSKKPHEISIGRKEVSLRVKMVFLQFIGTTFIEGYKNKYSLLTDQVKIRVPSRRTMENCCLIIVFERIGKTPQA